MRGMDYVLRLNMRGMDYVLRLNKQTNKQKQQQQINKHTNTKNNDNLCCSENSVLIGLPC